MAEGLGAGRTILVVDRDERTRKLVDLHLSNAGYRVLAAADALAAVRLLLREPPDLILADVQIRYLEGLEFLAAVRDDAAVRNIPVVFLTDAARPERAASRGAQAYLTRPVLAGRLLAVVTAQLARSLPLPGAGRPNAPQGRSAA
jgi:CheY-like chemotaxis protein